MKQKHACSYLMLTESAVGSHPDARQLLRVMKMQRLLSKEKNSEIVQTMFEYFAHEEEMTMDELCAMRNRLNEKNRLVLLGIIIEDFIDFYGEARRSLFADYNKTSHDLNERRAHYIDTINKGDCGLAALCISRVFERLTNRKMHLCAADGHAFIKYGDLYYDTRAQGWDIRHISGELTVGLLRTEMWDKFNGPDLLGAHVYLNFVSRWTNTGSSDLDGFALRLMTHPEMAFELEEPQMKELLKQVPYGQLQAYHIHVKAIDPQTGDCTFRFDSEGNQY